MTKEDPLFSVHSIVKRRNAAAVFQAANNRALQQLAAVASVDLQEN